MRGRGSYLHRSSSSSVCAPEKPGSQKRLYCAWLASGHPRRPSVLPGEFDQHPMPPPQDINWKDASNRDVTKDIRKTINHLQHSDIAVETDWTPGHSSIAGNDVAGELAKEAAVEASKFQEENGTSFHPEIMLACKQYTSVTKEMADTEIYPQ